MCSVHFFIPPNLFTKYYIYKISGIYTKSPGKTLENEFPGREYQNKPAVPPALTLMKSAPSLKNIYTDSGVFPYLLLFQTALSVHDAESLSEFPKKQSLRI